MVMVVVVGFRVLCLISRLSVDVGFGLVWVVVLWYDRTILVLI